MTWCPEHARDFVYWQAHLTNKHGGVEPAGAKSSGVVAGSPQTVEPEEPKGFHLRVRLQDTRPLRSAKTAFPTGRPSATLIGIGAETRKGETVNWILTKTQAEELKAGATEFTVLGYQILRYDGAHGAWENRREEPKR